MVKAYIKNHLCLRNKTLVPVFYRRIKYCYEFGVYEYFILRYNMDTDVLFRF